MTNQSATSNGFDERFSNIVKQLEDNALLIEEADVVIVCGKCNTYLTSISLKVSEMKCVNKTKLNNQKTDLVVFDDEYSAFNLINSIKRVGVADERCIRHMNGCASYTDFLSVLKNTQSVGVIDVIPNDIAARENILLEMASNQISGLVIAHRFLKRTRVRQPTALHLLLATTRSFGLKLLFIETMKDNQTGLIDLSFSKVKR